MSGVTVNVNKPLHCPILRTPFGAQFSPVISNLSITSMKKPVLLYKYYITKLTNAMDFIY